MNYNLFFLFLTIVSLFFDFRANPSYDRRLFGHFCLSDMVLALTSLLILNDLRLCLNLIVLITGSIVKFQAVRQTPTAVESTTKHYRGDRNYF